MNKVQRDGPEESVDDRVDDDVVPYLPNTHASGSQLTAKGSNGSYRSEKAGKPDFEEWKLESMDRLSALRNRLGNCNHRLLNLDSKLKVLTTSETNQSTWVLPNSMIADVNHNAEGWAGTASDSMQNVPLFKLRTIKQSPAAKLLSTLKDSGSARSELPNQFTTREEHLHDSNEIPHNSIEIPHAEDAKHSMDGDGWKDAEKWLVKRADIDAVDKGRGGHASSEQRTQSRGHSEDERYVGVESRIAHDMHVEKKDETYSDEPKSLNEAVGYSLAFCWGGFSKENFIRIKCFHVHKSPWWGAWFMIVNLANCAVVALTPELDKDSFNQNIEPSYLLFGVNLFDIMEYFTFITMFVEILTGCIAVGFIGNQRAWLRNSHFHKIDFTIFTLTIVDYMVSIIMGSAHFPFRVLRLFRLLRPIVKMKTFEKLKQMLQTLSLGFGQLTTVLLMLCFFTLAFALFGMAILRSSFRRRCVSLDHPISACATTLEEGDVNWNKGNCSFGGNATTILPGGDVAIGGGWMYPVDSTGEYSNCDLTTFAAGGAVEQACATMYGYQHFDHLGGTLLVLFQYTVPDSAYDPLHDALESEPEAAVFVWIYFFLISCINTFIMLGLVLAVITGTFKEAASKELSETRTSLRIRMEQSVPRKVLDLDNEEDGEALLMKWAQETLEDPRVRHSISAVIVLHAVALSAAGVNCPSGLSQAITVIYIIANMVFCCELVLRYLAVSNLHRFMKSSFNVFETCLVVFGISGLIFNANIFLLLPIFRLYRLMEYIPTMNDLLLNLISTNKVFVQLILFSALNTTAFAVLGRYIFRGGMESLTRSHYSDFSQAMLTTFQIFTGDQWSLIMYSAIASKNGVGIQLVAAAFILVWLFFSKIILYDLFVVVVIEYFKVSDTIDLIKQPGRISVMRQGMRRFYQKFFILMAEAHKSDREGSLELENIKRINSVAAENRLSPNGMEEESLATHSYVDLSCVFSPENKYLLKGIDSSTAELLRAATIETKVYDIVDGVKSTHKEAHTAVRSLFCFHLDNPIRSGCLWLQDNIIFNGVVYLAILLSCLLLMSTPPAPDIPGENHLISESTRYAWDIVFTVVFTIEVIVRVIAQGLILSKTAYLRSWWNVMDFCIVMVSLMDVMGIFGGNVSKVFRLARALRPLRLIKRNKSLRILMEALLCTLFPVSYVIGFSMLTGAIFAILGKGLFGGMLFRCTYGAEYPEGQVQCSGLFVSEENGILFPRAWINPPYNFDTLYQATLTVFRIETLKFVDVLRASMDITARNVSPKENFSAGNSLFFVAYILLGPVIIMNLFIAFICDGFNVYRRTSEVDLYYSKFIRQIEHIRPRERWFKPPSNQLSDSVRLVADSQSFKGFSMACVGINICFMLSDHADATNEFNIFMDTQNFIFFLELVFEVGLGILGYGIIGLVDDRWRAFDGLVMLGTAVGYMSSSKDISTFAKAFRLFRVIRLMRMFKPIRIILETLMTIAPQVGNIVLLLFLIYSIFATLFVQLFGVIKYGERIGPTANFHSFPTSLATIYQLVTQDEWMAIMDDAEIQPPFCTLRFDSLHVHGYTGPAYSFGDCGSSYSRYYFVIFKLICECILLNLFIGVVLENFGFITEEISDRVDPAWRFGPSNQQVVDIATTFERLSNFRRNISVRTVVDSLLFHLDVPIGFHYKPALSLVPGSLQSNHGSGTDVGVTSAWEYEANEKAVLRLIRAELNVVLYERRCAEVAAAAAAAQENLWRPGRRIRAAVEVAAGALIAALLPERSRRTKRPFINGVSFEEVMMVLLHWRKPSLVPPDVKAARRQRIEAVLKMGAALVVTDFFRKLVGRKWSRDGKERLLKERARLSRPHSWMERYATADPHSGVPVKPDQ